MSPPAYFPRSLTNGGAIAARSGLYPNSEGSEDHRFHVPAVAIAPTLLNHDITSLTNLAPGTNTHDGSPSNQQASTSSAEGSGISSAAATLGHDGATNLANDLNAMDTDNVSESEDDDSMASPEGSSFGEEKIDTLSDLETVGNESEEETDAESDTIQELAPEPHVKNSRTAPTKRKRKPVGKVQKAIAKKGGPSKVKTSKPKCSAQTLKPERFATKDYKESRNLEPPHRLFKPAKSSNDPGAATGASPGRRFNSSEVDDIVRLLGLVTSPLQRTYFDSTEETISIDRKIALGFKLSQDQDESDTERQQKSLKGPGKKNQLFLFNGLNTMLKPLDNIDDIFADLTENALKNGFTEFLEAFGSGKLKVSTLCSGTESPLLAMQMIRDSLKNHPEYSFLIDHQFSCEIEPFKQAYIQRNFRPAILFRDVVELKHKKAHTAFGGREFVPNDADIMIAGSSCVDYSPLNSRPKEFGANGESYETLTATVDYAKKHRPIIVILENVFNFPWREVERMWRDAGYATKVAYLDSKDFYLPQTRQRGYMIGLRRAAITERKVELDADTAVEKWFEVLGKLQRRASSPFTDFILPDDDPQLQKYNQRAAVFLAAGKTVSWDKCKVECISYRSCNFLGFKKPVTDWETNGSCKVPDFCNTLWFKRQVERIWDTVDINHLRSVAARCYDMAYKCRCIDLSQSCLRESDKKPWGMVGCITASANPYLTHRGGPMVGAEALSLQGIPLGRLILNRESSRQLVDLSGNAMTTTAVGAAILAALTCCSKLFVPRQVMPLKSLAASGKPITSLKYNSSWLLTKTDLTMNVQCPITVAEIRDLAFRSIRLCSCESLIPKISQNFQQCSRCGHTSCEGCGKKPTHMYVPIILEAAKKESPSIAFEKRMRQALPPRLVVCGLQSALEAVRPMCLGQPGGEYVAAIKAAAVEECRLVSIKRDRGWSIIYEGPCSRFVLTIQREWDGRVLCAKTLDDLAATVSVQWKVYAKPGPEMSADSPTRKVLMHPIARLICSEFLFDGKWELRVAERQSFMLEVVGKGEKVSSWERKQGLEDPLFKNRFVWSTFEFRLPAGTIPSGKTAPKSILGTYDLLENCGTACGSLHVQRKPSLAKTEEHVFLFLDPALLCNASYDSFVFANQHHKLGLKEVREVLAKVDTSWRPSDTDEVSQLSCEVPSRWIPVDGVQLREHAPNDLQNVHLATADTAIRVSTTPCNTSGLPVVWCKFPMTRAIRQDLGLETRKCFELVKNPFSLTPLSWLIQTAGQALKFAEWHQLPVETDLASRCVTCAPKPPGVVWKDVKYKNGRQIRPFENVSEACDYERSLKVAPEAVTAELSYDDNSKSAALKIDLNILTLVHKAVAALSGSRPCFSLPSTCHWRAVVDHGYDYQVAFPQIKLKDCQSHKEAPQPPSFGGNYLPGSKPGPLLKESQLKSFDWMIRQEEEGGKLWEEQEVVEAFAAPMSLRLEARVTACRRIMGGVLADDVGYGKTALVLALIDYHFQKKRPVSPPFNEEVDELIKLKATLILIPPNLVDQWQEEIKRFVGPTYQFLILTKTTFKSRSRVSKFQEADIILATWDLFDDKYFEELARMSRAYHTPVSAGRGFEEWFHMAVEDFKTLLKRSHGLQPEHLSSAWDKLETDKYKKFIELSKRNKKGSETTANVANKPPSKKLKAQDQNVDQMEIEEPTAPFLPLHGCIFERVVVDEFTYVGAKQLPAIMALQSLRRWILSGTPPHNTFDGVSSMANLLGTSVGIPDDAALRYQKVKDLTRQTSGGEVLRSYATSHSPDWYKERHAKAEAFVAKFVRKNTAFVRGIKKHDHYQMVVLAALERALYFEVFLLLVNEGIRTGKKEKRGSVPKKAEAELTRKDRIVEHIVASELPEDALITLCSTMPDFAVEHSTVSPCGVTIAEKETLIVEKVQDMVSELRGAFWITSKWEDDIAVIPDIYNYLRSVQENRFGDATACALMDLVIAYAEDTKQWTVAKSIENKEPKGKLSHEKKEQYRMRIDSANEPHKLDKVGRAEDLKLRADSLTAWTIALTDVVRERRFFIGTQSCLSGAEIECSSCGRRSKDCSTMRFMGRCGHVGCKQCCLARPLDQCLDGHCSSKTLETSTVEASDLTAALPSQLAREHGSKMVAITELLDRIPAGEKVLIFVQFGRIITALKTILAARDIRFADTTEAKGAAANVEMFKGDLGCNVCVLQLDSANAAGWNLQYANHVIFVSSLVARTQHEYKASITQAIGRVLRMGQTNPVHVYYVLAEKTIEVNILEDRKGKVLVERGGTSLLVSDALKGEEDRFRGLPFRGAACGAGVDLDDDDEDEGEGGGDGEDRA